MERVFVTGATGFVGGSVAAELVASGADVLCAVRRDPGPGFQWPWRVTDLGNTFDIGSALVEHRATSVIHLAIDGDFMSLERNRRAGFDGYVGMTRRVVDAANANGALVGLVSTDWVFDGTGHRVEEDEPVNPVNLYGMFKALSERVVLDRAHCGFVARVGGVQGRNIARPELPWLQNCGFGNLALAAIETLSADREFTVWQDPAINEVASPIAASQIGKMLAVALRQRADGILHIVGADAVSRIGLVEATCEAFDLDMNLVRTGPVPEGQMLDARMPRDSSLGTTRTDDVLGVRPLGVFAQLDLLRTELEAHPSSR